MPSTLETLPDELLLEMCRYLLSVDVLRSFFGLNERITRLIKDYRHHVSLHKSCFACSTDLYVNIFPKIGLHIQTLVIDRLYSVLQDDMFYRYFHEQKLSSLLPRLKKVTLVAFRHETLLTFVHMLEGFEHLLELDIRNLFNISLEHQATVLEALMKANNQKISSVLISHCWSPLRVDNSSNISYSNIINLQLTMATLNDLALLFSAIPNVRQLDIMLLENDPLTLFHNETPSLVHLTKFRFISTRRPWTVEDLPPVFEHMPNLEHLSLELLTYDIRLVDGQEILRLQHLCSHIRQVNYDVYYIVEKERFDRATTLASWPSSSIECLCDETSNANDILAYIYTLSSRSAWSTSLALPGNLIRKAMPNKPGDSQIQQLNIDSVSTFIECLPLMTHWPRTKHLVIWFSTTAPTDTELQQQRQSLMFPKMGRLKHLEIYGSVPRDLDHLSRILISAPNLIRLDLSFDSLLPLIDNEEASRLFQQRITALSIHKVSSSTSVTLSEDHLPRIAAVFVRLSHMFVDLTHLLPSMDSMVLRILTEFNKRLVSLGVDGIPSDEMKTDARKWLEDNNHKCNNTIVHHTAFDASFIVPSNRLLVWM